MPENKYLDKVGLVHVWLKILDKLINFVDSKTTEINDNNLILLKGYTQATNGLMLVKDSVKGISWTNPLSDAILLEAVRQAEASKVLAGNYATLAGNSAVSSDTSARAALSINLQTMNWVNKKFWWGTISEYNTLESIDEGTFYFILM